MHGWKPGGLWSRAQLDGRRFCRREPRLIAKWCGSPKKRLRLDRQRAWTRREDWGVETRTSQKNETRTKRQTGKDLKNDILVAVGRKKQTCRKHNLWMLHHPAEMEFGIKLKFLAFTVPFYYCAAQKMAVLPAIMFSAHCRGPCNNLNGSNPANKSPVYQHYITKQIGRGKKKEEEEYYIRT